uniref:USP domain-containing protein n=1 Tax=Aegilops tauschii subsp. strangulata TaxID=200361 RepID=A0A453QZ28_AEGTS
MVNLLESMHKCCLPSGVPSESASAYEKSLVHRIFGGRLRSQVKCTRCSHCSNTFDPFLDLSLDIGKATTLVRALQNFTEDELLDGGQKQYQCERCRQKVVAKKRFTIDRAPNVLTVHLKRFSPFRPREKIDKKVDFQPVLDLKPFMSDSKV